MPRALGLGLLVVSATWSGPVSAQGGGGGGDAPPPPPQPTPLEGLFQPVREMLKPLPPFLANTDLKVNFRSYYFNRTNPDDTVNEAWAFGGRITYQSGWLFDTFAMGASLYGSAPLYAPDDRDGTLLLKPGQEGYYVPAEAWGALRYQEYALLKGYRQRVDQTYINSQDNRMTPNTFQGVTLGGKVSWLEYLGGYLWKIKPRNADEFISMSEQAGGGADSNDGVGLLGVRLTPLQGLRIDVSNQYGVNTFNTFYAEAEYLMPLSENWSLRIGAQFTDQRAVGDALLPAGRRQVLGHAVRRGARAGDLPGPHAHGGVLDHRRRQYHPEPLGELARVPLHDRPGLRSREGVGGAGRRRLRLQRARHGPERQHQLRLGMECHQSLHADEGSQSSGVRLHRRLPASLPACPSCRECGSVRGRPSSISRTPRRSATSSASPSTGTGT